MNFVRICVVSPSTYPRKADVLAKRVAVVGAGMGSLAAAIRLSAMGFEVEVFENDQLGGRIGRLEEGGFTFDTGPSLLLMTDTYRELYAAILARIEAQGYDIYARRAETSPFGKLKVAARCAM